jgi:phospholipase C
MGTNGPSRRGLTRRTLLRRGGALGAALSLPSLGGLLDAAGAGAAAAVRAPGSLPHPALPAGTVNAAMPFDHIVVVMMENHSFDNLLGALSQTGQPAADGLTFDAAGVATNSNPYQGAAVTSFIQPDTAQHPSVSQTWADTHVQINGGKMNGFPRSVATDEPMAYYTQEVLPFAYSLARTFTLANRWFCSAPCQTYPNRRFLMAATAYGDIATDTASLEDPAPPNGTIFDQLSAYGISWRNYFTDLPQTAIIPTIIEQHAANISPVAEFHAACATGTLPQVSFVDPEFGALSDIGSPLASLSQLSLISGIGKDLETVGGDEESPQDMYWGEAWAHEIITSVLSSPAWSRTLLIYTYDEHGGYYDHVPPPAAIKPDDIKPVLAAGDPAGGYNLYGPRVPAIVVSPYSKPNAVTDVVHDHTSVLATIEAKFNLPALTYRDANAATVMDFLDTSHAAFATPPTIAGPSLTGPSGPRV